jgi:hypothetical protein
MYNKIYEFCAVRNLGGVFKNSADEPTPRVKFIMNLLNSEGIEFTLDKFVSNETTCYNIIMKGTSNRMVVAHHDVANPAVDNANDNSCSVINAIMVKKLLPAMNVVLTDGEEYGGIGANYLSAQINNGDFGAIEWVLNLELTGIGGKNFFIGNYTGKLYDHIKSLFECPVLNTPFNDSVIFRKNNIDSVVINPLPILLDGESPLKYNGVFLDHKILYRCHTPQDTVDKISTGEMKEFVEEVVIKILTS